METYLTHNENVITGQKIFTVNHNIFFSMELLRKYLIFSMLGDILKYNLKLYSIIYNENTLYNSIDATGHLANTMRGDYSHLKTHSHTEENSLVKEM